MDAVFTSCYVSYSSYIRWLRVLQQSQQIARAVHVCYSVMNMYATLRTFKDLLLRGDEVAAKQLLEDLSGRIKYDSNIEFEKLQKDELGTTLIPDDTAENPTRNLAVALKSTGNGNCFFNSMSILLCGDESLSDLLRILVAGELHFYAEFYKDHEVFRKAKQTLSEVSEPAIFSVALSADGDQTLMNTGNRTEAIKAEALAACERGAWSSLLHMMAMASVISRPVYSLYPKVEFLYRPLVHGLLNPRIPCMQDEGKVGPLYVLWSRDGGLDSRPNAWYTPNHFVPVVMVAPMAPTEKSPTVDISATSKKSKQGNLLSFFKTTADNKVPKSNGKKDDRGNDTKKKSEKRGQEVAGLNDEIQPCKKVDSNKKEGTKRKFLQQWKEEFPSLVYHKEENMMTCNICCTVPEVAGRSEFLAGCHTLKKETLQKHNIGGGHIRARDVVLARQKPVDESPIAQSLGKGRKATEEQGHKEVAVKINTAYLIAKEELPFSKFGAILSLQKKNGLDINLTYANAKSCNKLVSVISKVFQKELANKVNEGKYISIMIDGATDASGKENETVHCRFVESGKPVNQLVGHKAVGHAHAEGTL